MELGCYRFMPMILGLSGFLAVNSFAYPMNPLPTTIDNGGDSLTIRTVGDEHYRYTQTEDGVLVVSDSNGVYYYADETGAASKFKAKNAGKRSAEAKKFLNGLDKHKVHRKHHEKHPDRFKRPAGERAKRAAWVPTASNAVESSSAASSENVPLVLRLPKASGHANGTNRIPVLLIENNSTSNIDSTKLDAFLNQEGYTANNYTGSVRDYFVDQSSGKFVPTFDPYFVKLNESSFSGYIGNEYGLIKKGIEAMLNKYTSFDASLYDSDNNGDVDALAVLFAGGEVKNQSGDHLGGFQYEMQWNRDGWNGGGKISAGKGKKFNSYFIIQQKDYLFPTFVHEFSHTMGLKDHYCVYSDECYANFKNSDYQAPGAHAWDVMATGMYNNGGITPPNYSAFERNFMGWLKYDTLTVTDGVVAIPPLDSENFAYRISFSNDEWFILENRRKNKWDAALPNHGMLIWHIDYNDQAWQNDAMNDDKAHQRVDVVEAGNLRVTSYDDGFMRSSYYGGGARSPNLEDDPFPGSQNVTEYGPFTSWKGSSKDIKLYEITVKNGNVCFATKQGVQVTDCEFVQSSSSVESSSSVALSSAVLSSSSTVLASSNSLRSSSSYSRWRRSSSSMSLTESSSSGSIRIATAVNAGFRIGLEGHMLNVFAPEAGSKVRLFDAQGHLLLETAVAAPHSSVDLSAFAGKGMLVVQLACDGRSRGAWRITVR